MKIAKINTSQMQAPPKTLNNLVLAINKHLKVVKSELVGGQVWYNEWGGGGGGGGGGRFTLQIMKPTSTRNMLMTESVEPVILCMESGMVSQPGEKA